MNKTVFVNFAKIVLRLALLGSYCGKWLHNRLSSLVTTKNRSKRYNQTSACADNT